jgi:hypothetical protein
MWLTTGWMAGIRFPVATGILLFTSMSNKALGSTQPPNQWVPAVVSWLKAVGAWNWALTSVYYRGLEFVYIYLHAHHIQSSGVYSRQRKQLYICLATQNTLPSRVSFITVQYYFTFIFWGTSYIRRFGNYLSSRLMFIGCHNDSRIFIVFISMSVAAVGSNLES